MKKAPPVGNYGAVGNEPATMLFHQAADSTVERAARLGLSPELLRRVRARLKRLLLVMLIVVTASLFVTVAIGIAADRTLDQMSDVLRGTIVTILVTGTGYLAMRSTAIRDDLAVWFGFAMELFLAASSAMGNYVGYYAEHGHLPMIPWTVGVMLIFPLVVPRPPKLTLVLAFLSGSFIPGIAWWLDAAGEIQTHPDELIKLSVNAVFAIGIAYFSSRIAYGLSIDADQARQMGSYHLETKLGAGGMGEVWSARHRLLARPAAVKLIRTDAAHGAIDARALQRFEREAQATASLKSPHTIDLYDFGITEDRSFYYVMELVDGIDLQELVDRVGPLPANRVVHLLRQVCHSLHEAHLAGLIHRDIKPANLFICRHGTELDFVKVLDFGLVKEIEQVTNGEDADLTARGIIVGTPAYMPPEMALGAKEIDGRADLYSLGCVAYWLLTGTTLFSAESPMQTLVDHVNEHPEPPSARSELPIPPELDQLVLCCLQKKPEDRPADAEELSARLSSIPIEPSWTRIDAREWWDTHRPAS